MSTGKPFWHPEGPLQPALESLTTTNHVARNSLRGQERLVKPTAVLKVAAKILTGARRTAHTTPLPPQAPPPPHFFEPSSMLREVAAATASITAERTPPASSCRRPAAVVPPGDVTAARSSSGLCPEAESRRADPSSV